MFIEIYDRFIGTIEQFIERLGFMYLSASQMKVQLMPVAVTKNVDLR